MNSDHKSPREDASQMVRSPRPSAFEARHENSIASSPSGKPAIYSEITSKKPSLRYLQTSPVGVNIADLSSAACVLYDSLAFIANSTINQGVRLFGRTRTPCRAHSRLRRCRPAWHSMYMSTVGCAFQTRSCMPTTCVWVNHTENRCRSNRKSGGESIPAPASLMATPSV